jgi:ATP-binding cassette subfamily B multidrug efflux pump
MSFSISSVFSRRVPLLITRNTNAVQQVQMLVLLTCTILVAARMLSIDGIDKPAA